MSIKAIETEYNGYRFRSRLEARWAVFFDAMGMEYLYEPEGIELSDGTYYLPDFYFPESNSFFEVKGVMDDLSEHKIEQFIKDGYRLTVGFGDMSFQACDVWWDEHNLTLADKSASILCKCGKCGSFWFMGLNGFYECQCCGEYDGDHHFGIEGYGKLDGFFSSEAFDCAIKISRQARFEHMETPTKESLTNYIKTHDYSFSIDSHCVKHIKNDRLTLAEELKHIKMEILREEETV